MSTTGPVQVAPVPASIDNPEEWPTLAAQLGTASAIPTQVTPEMLVGMISSAVPLLFAADATGNADLLRGTFADLVVAQCLRNLGDLAGARPLKTSIHLVGSRLVDGRPVVRVHLAIQTEDPDGSSGAQNQFWDLQSGGEVTVGQPTCPNCGAPIETGKLICSHCHADVRSVVAVPLVVSRLELY